MDSNESRARALLGDLSAGCSVVAWETADGGHLWGRNFDFNRIAADSKVTFVPRGQVFYACGTELEGNLEPSTRCTAAYAAVGIGSLVLRSTPALYEGLNEKGLMGGQLYYRTFAHFAPEARPGTLPLQPPFLVTWCLATCASVEEVARALEERVSLVAIPMLGTVPPIHWMFSDRTGESIVVESDRDGLHIYRNTVGVMTNSPGYPWHRTNLLNYPQLRPLDYGELAWGGERLEPCFSGSGAAGLPGDWSSPSRFVRLAFLREHAVKGGDEAEGVSLLFRLLHSAAFPLGAVELTGPGGLTPMLQQEPVGVFRQELGALGEEVLFPLIGELNVVADLRVFRHGIHYACRVETGRTVPDDKVQLGYHGKGRVPGPVVPHERALVGVLYRQPR